MLDTSRGASLNEVERDKISIMDVTDGENPYVRHGL
jgi:hypothetical protein